MKLEIFDEKIVEVKITRNEKEANTLLNDNWILIHGGVSHVDAQGFNAKVVLILGRVEKTKE